MFTSILLLALMQEPEALTRSLSDDDPARRARAYEALLKLGPGTLPILRRQLAESGDPDFRCLAERLIRQIEWADLSNHLNMEVVPPEEEPEFSETHFYHFTLRLINDGELDMVVHDFFRLRVLDEGGNEVQREDAVAPSEPFSFHECGLNDLRFLVVPAGKTLDVTINLGTDFRALVFSPGWTIPSAGTYTLEVTYDFDPAVWTERCDKGCVFHRDPQMRWNQAPKMTRTVSGRMTVAP